MFKLVITSSVQSAFVAALLLIVISLPSYGAAATIFGIIALPVALIICLVFAYPLIRLWQYYSWSIRVSFAIFTVFGFTLGILIPILFFGVGGTEISIRSATFLGLSGVLGFVCSSTAWNFVRKQVAL
ncbi:hypothetical protein [Pseudoalteromonas piscicida]|uniref:hypothetical protein n=1 Tax=Pseudoalteromonas piscicida TaxID=43662 RepID=UPI0030B2C170